MSIISIALTIYDLREVSLTTNTMVSKKKNSDFVEILLEKSIMGE